MGRPLIRNYARQIAEENEPNYITIGWILADYVRKAHRGVASLGSKDGPAALSQNPDYEPP